MKAITCPQCGALLEDISVEKKIARCSYCRAKILIRPFGDRGEVEVSLTNRAEGGKEEKEIYQRGDLIFAKQKFKPNDIERLAYLSQRKSERMKNFYLFALVLGIVVFVLIAVFLSLT